MSKTTDVGSITNSVIMAMDKEFRTNKIYTFPKKHNEVRPIIHAIVASAMSEYRNFKPEVGFVVPTGNTTDVDGITAASLRALDRELRKNDVFAFPTQYSEIRPIIHGLVAEVFADHIAEMILEETRDVR